MKAKHLMMEHGLKKREKKVDNQKGRKKLETKQNAPTTAIEMQSKRNGGATSTAYDITSNLTVSFIGLCDIRPYPTCRSHSQGIP